jgi:hypothetical protein
MKLENIKRSIQLTPQLSALDRAINDVTIFLDKKTKDTFGYECSNEVNSIYSFHLAGQNDGSSPIANLTNCGIAIDTVKYIKNLLEVRKEVVIKEIESL